MNLSMTPERDSAPAYRLARWLLLGLIAAGIVGMHVLSAQGAGGGHGMVMDNRTVAMVAAQPATVTGSSDHVNMTHRSAAPISRSTPAVAPADTGIPGSMATCLLFLAGGAAAFTLLLLAHRRRLGKPDPAGRSTPSWVFTRRGPPRSAASLDSLCILRV